jgi:subtilisin
MSWGTKAKGAEMQRLVQVLAMLAIGLVALPGPLFQPASASVFDPKDYAEVVIELDEGIDPLGYADYFLGQLGVTYEEHSARRVHHIYRHAILGFSVYLTADELRAAEQLDLIGVHSMTESVWGQVGITPITDIEGQLPLQSLPPNSEVVPTGISRAGASPDGVDYSNVDVAVIDTGIDKMHPDLNVIGGEDCVSSYGETPDYGLDGNGHGTHVAGTVAARSNGMGVVGMAPGARLWSYKVLNAAGSGSYASVICGIDAVAANADVIDVVNMSLGGGGGESACDADDPMHSAMCSLDRLGVVVVVAAGNASSDASSHVPATYDEVITTSAWTDYNGQVGGGAMPPQSGCYAMSTEENPAAFSNFGQDVDISAPGVCILSTAPGTLVGVGGYSPNYSTISGTSMASPHVAGCIARFISQNPDQSEYARRQVLMWSEAHGVVTGDKDIYAEPLLWCDQVPRYEGSDKDYDPDGA